MSNNWSPALLLHADSGRAHLPLTLPFQAQSSKLVSPSCQLWRCHKAWVANIYLALPEHIKYSCFKWLVQGSTICSANDGKGNINSSPEQTSSHGALLMFSLEFTDHEQTYLEPLSIQRPSTGQGDGHVVRDHPNWYQISDHKFCRSILEKAFWSLLLMTLKLQTQSRK